MKYTISINDIYEVFEGSPSEIAELLDYQAGNGIDYSMEENESVGARIARQSNKMMGMTEDESNIPTISPISFKEDISTKKALFNDIVEDIQRSMRQL